MGVTGVQTCSLQIGGRGYTRTPAIRSGDWGEPITEPIPLGHPAIARSRSPDDISRRPAGATGCAAIVCEIVGCDIRCVPPIREQDRLSWLARAPPDSPRATESRTCPR